MINTYQQYYKVQLENGLQFQDFCIDAAWTLIGLAVVQYGSRLYQQTLGESRTGVEIKYDQKFSKTGNLWIECSEKANQRPGNYIESGINRNDNTWLYFIGDYDTIFIFAKTMLMGLSQSGRYLMRENNTKTSVGFLLPAKDAERYAAAILRPNAAKKVASAVHDLKALGQALHQMAKENPRQMSLIDPPV